MCVQVYSILKLWLTKQLDKLCLSCEEIPVASKKHCKESISLSLPVSSYDNM